MLQQGSDSLELALTRALRKSLCMMRRAAGENTHMLVASSVFIQRQHDDELRLLVTPHNGRFQACDADSGLLNVF